MTRIAHTADVHIRSLSRHDEYREVLTSFIEKSRDLGVDHFFIVGDVFHTKTSGISPEYIDMLTWWLRSMASHACVHIMLGNHDGNLSNLSRQDAVSPIVNALNDDRIRLYKKSGTYPVDDLIDLVIFSPFDEHGWKDVRPTVGKVNVAGYHGAVRNSLTESEWNLTDGVECSFFDDYDIVMLGDIHKSQVLRRTSGRPSMVYPGTPIQQNYGEDVVRSFTFWDIRGKDDWDVKFVDLPNPKPFVTVDWSGSPQETFKKLECLTPGTRIRIRSDDALSHDDVHVISELARTRAVASEVVFKTENEKIDTTKLTAGDIVVSKSDVKSPDVIVSLVSEFHKGIPDDEVTSIKERVSSYLVGSRNNDDVTRGTSWSIDTLEWDNLFSYGEGNRIDFKKLSGIVGIFGPNRIGKSSFVGSIMYTFFNTSDRGSMKNSLICNVRKDMCRSAATFAVDGSEHLIERQTVKTVNRKGVQNAVTSLSLFRSDDGNFTDMCGEQRNDTEKSLRNLIGTSEDFLVTSVSSQRDPNDFISLGPSKRRSLLSRFLHLDVFDSLYDAASKDLASVKARLKTYPEIDWDAEQERLSLSIRERTIEIARIKERIEETRSEMSDKTSLLKDLCIDDVDIESLETRVAELTSHLQKARSTRNKIESDLRSAEEDMSSIASKLLDDEALGALEELRDSFESLTTELKTFTHQRDIKASEDKRRLKTIGILDEVPCGDEYPTCKFIKDAMALRETNDAWRRSMGDLESSIVDLTKRLDDFRRTHGDVAERISANGKNSVLYERRRADVSSLESKVEKAASLIATLSADLRDVVSQLEKARSTQDKSVAVRRKNLQGEIQRLSDDDRRLMSSLTSHASSLGKDERDLEDIRRRHVERDVLLEEARMLSRLTSAFSKKGVPLLVTRSQLPAINAAISSVLNGIVDFDVSLEVDDDTDTLEIVVDYGDSRRYIEMCSGMEKTMASLAVRVGLSKVTSLPKPDFFVIDEGFGTLDAGAVESCNRFLTSLKRHFKTVFVITHVDGIKDCADHVLEITRNEKDSCLVAI